MRWFNIAGFGKSILASALASKSRDSRLDSPLSTSYTCAALAIHGFGFQSGRCTGFIHSTGLFMSIIYYLTADQIMVGVASSSKKQVIEQLAERTAELTGLCQRSLFNIVMRRERLGSTAIGGGIAIPHAVHHDLTRTIAIIAVLTDPVDFDAQDRKPVDIVCLVIGPQNADSDHLKCVSSVARSLREVATCDQLRAAKTSTELLGCFGNAGDVAA
jgi:PTS system nitrogen regulatory IIA component